MSNEEQPFQITVSEEALSLLKRKLDDARFPDEINDAEWAYGAPLANIKRLTERWRDGYDWRVHERELNKLPMFTRSIEVQGFGDMSVHYVHQRSSVRGAIPLLFVHGCESPFCTPPFCLPSSFYCACSPGPGSFLEVTKMLPLLTAASPDHPSFHVVAPSLPGFAWSEGARKKGFRPEHYAEVCAISLAYITYGLSHLGRSALQQTDDLSGLHGICDARRGLGSCGEMPTLVMPQSGSEPRFGPEPFRTGPKSGPRFGIVPKLNWKSGSRFGRGPN